MEKNQIIFQLKNTNPDNFPGHKAHLELTPYRKNVQQVDVQMHNPRQGAVAVILDFSTNQPSILLTKRADYKGVHGGQISFPGGKQEIADSDLVETAMRETHEEIGIQLLREHFINRLTPIYIPPSNFLVNPFLFIKQNASQFTTNQEVDYMLLLSLQQLLHDLPISKTTIHLYNGLQLKDAPCFNLNGEIVWGATAAILNELKWILLAQERSTTKV